MHLKLLMILLLKTANISQGKEYFNRNMQVHQYIYATLFPKYFCWVDDYSVKSKVAFGIAYGVYKNEQENIHIFCKMLIKQEVVETSEVVEICQSPPSSTPSPEAKKKECKLPKKRKAKYEC